MWKWNDGEGRREALVKPTQGKWKKREYYWFKCLFLNSHVLCLNKVCVKDSEERKGRGSTLAPTPSNSCRSTSTCLSSEQAVEEASLWWRVGSVHVQVWAQGPVRLVDIDFFKAAHFNHLQRDRSDRRVKCSDGQASVRDTDGWTATWTGQWQMEQPDCAGVMWPGTLLLFYQ